jgi:hypothetical protein
MTALGLMGFQNGPAWFSATYQRTSGTCGTIAQAFGLPCESPENFREHMPRVLRSWVWCGIIGNYSYQNLTHTSDRLPALSGLANMFGGGEEATSKYMAGHWRDDFVQSLT